MASEGSEVDVKRERDPEPKFLDSIGDTNFDPQYPGEKRIRSQTEAGKEQYLEYLSKYLCQEEKTWMPIEDLVVDISENLSLKNIRDLRKLRTELKFTSSYLGCTNDIISYLQRTNTHESLEEKSKQSARFKKRTAILRQLSTQIEDAILDLADTLSRSGTGGSTYSSASRLTPLAKKKMVAEAERAKLAFIHKEVNLKQEQAKIQGQLDILDQSRTAAIAAADDQSRTAAIAAAEVKALEAADDQLSELKNLPDDVGSDQRVEEYVASVACNDIHTNQSCDIPTSDIPLEGQTTEDPNNVVPSRADPIDSISRYLLKKEVLISRFKNFSDEPEAYNAWKVNFVSTIRELKVTPFEELQLLVRWLGPESSKFAADIQQANASNPTEGLSQIWTRLDERYGAIELIDYSLKSKIASFPQLSVKDPKELFRLADILTQIDGVKKNPKYAGALSYYDTSLGISPIISKLPYQWREKWISKASDYKARIGVPYPPFTYFVTFVQELSRVRNDPAFQFEDRRETRPRERYTGIMSRKVSTKVESSGHLSKQLCPLEHQKEAKHALVNCKKFRSLPLTARKKILRENRICFRCCETKEHMARNCKQRIKCDVCSSRFHCGALHSVPSDGAKNEHSDGGETVAKDNQEVVNNCTRICNPPYAGKSCAKTILTYLYPVGREDLKRKAYLMMDDQSCQTLGRSAFFDMFNISGEVITYTLTACSGSVMVTGRKASNFIAAPLDGVGQIRISSVIECDDIPSSREEIPTPEVVRHFPHLLDLESKIPQMDYEAEILLLVGRDNPDAHHVLEQRLGPPNSPFAQRLPLGWTVIGECCLGRVHKPHIIANKTQVLASGKGTIFTPCPTHVNVSRYSEDIERPHDNVMVDSKILERTKDDNTPGLSIEDREFLSIMEAECHKDESGHWSAPLPFRPNRSVLPNNREQAFKRAHSLLAVFRKDPVKRNQAISFMERVFQSGHAEEAPDLKDGEDCWYLPIFPVYHPKKPNQIRMVFDSSASYQGHSLNSALLSGPDLINSLIGILIRFRRERIAISGDIEQMFHMFKIDEKHRNFVRFIWFTNNNPDKPLKEFRMCVHLFGNSPSPAVATYCLRKCVEEPCDSDVREFVMRNFYVDDGLSSFDSEEEALDVLLRTQRRLKEAGQLRFHKFSSNSQKLLDSVPPDDRSKDLNDVYLDLTSAPLQRSLGLGWNLPSDSFVFTTDNRDLPTTKRSILSCLHGLYDPLGFLSPVLLTGKLIFRELTLIPLDWDDPLPKEIEQRWKIWWASLHHLRDIQIPRAYVPISLKNSDKVELHTFADASEKAVSAVTYVYVVNSGSSHTGFVMGKSKIAPQHATTIPRLELCAALLASELAAFVERQFDIAISSSRFYTDSLVVLGYLNNRCRRFHTYVSNRVHRILCNSRSSRWCHVRSEDNPADNGTRSITACEFKSSTWLNGPNFLDSQVDSQANEEYVLLDPENDVEIKKSVSVSKTNIRQGLRTDIFEKFSTWKSLIRALAKLRSVLRRRLGLETLPAATLYRKTELLVIGTSQRKHYCQDIEALLFCKPLAKGSPLKSLDPYVGDDGLLHVGGRIQTGDALSGSDGPIVIPGKSRVARLLVIHQHEIVKHQGRRITEGAVRQAGYWVKGTKRLIPSVLFSCVICRKLRRKLETQKMGNLPVFRCKPSPPFTYVGVDAFGPWEILTRKTRGGSANSKRWGILFTCMTSRAIHIELVDEMSSATFINALRRFVSVRGKVSEFYSDRGTNFVGCTDALHMNTVNVESAIVNKFLVDNACTWNFNPPHASHMGGAWERMIGTIRKILDALLMASKKPLTHDILNTFMYEVCAIINSRPLADISSDPTNPSVLSPSVLLTQKTDIDVAPFESIQLKEMYKSSWQHTQVLANQFWKRWQQDYLHSLQNRRKWTDSKEDIKVNDVVLLKDQDNVRYEWPLALVLRTFPSKDGKVRKVELRVSKKGNCVNFVRPVTEIVHLFSS